MAKDKKPDTEPNVMTPGQVISPRDASAPTQTAEQPTPAAETPVEPASKTEPAPAPVEPAVKPSDNQAIPPTSESSQTFKFQSDSEQATRGAEDMPEDGITWEASEFILHEKSPGWYLGLMAFAILLAGVIYLITRDLISVGVILFGAFMFGVYAARKPRQLSYQVDNRGVQISNKAFGYDSFRCFSIVQEGAFSSIVFSPLKRFSPLTTIYYPPEQEEEIVSMVSDYLPLEERSQDPVDKLMHKIGF